MTGGNLGKHTGSPVISNDKICVRSCDSKPVTGSANIVNAPWITLGLCSLVAVLYLKL